MRKNRNPPSEPALILKTPQELEILGKTCSQALDSTVSVEQDEQGRLTFVYPASKHGHRLTAQPWDKTHDGQQLWKFLLEDLDTAPIGTLEPLMICGLLHF